MSERSRESRENSSLEQFSFTRVKEPYYFVTVVLVDEVAELFGSASACGLINPGSVDFLTVVVDRLPADDFSADLWAFT